MPHFPFARPHDYEPPVENAELRHNAPVSKVNLFDGSEAWIVMKHKDVCEALRSEVLSADRRTPGYPEIHESGKKASEARPTFVNLDNPAHKTQRNMLEPAFTPEAVEKLRPMMQRTVDSVLDKMISEGCKEPVDLVDKFCTPIPTQIVYRILGVPEEDIEGLSHDSEIRSSTSRNAAETSNHNLQEYMHKLVDKRIEKPENDLISKLVVEQYKPGHLEKEDVGNLAFLVLVAGNAALINSIALGVLTLQQHPAQLDELKKDPSLAPKAVNEILRYHTASALNSRRVAKEDIKIGGQHIQQGEGVICSVQSADRDEAFYDHPDNFDIHRSQATNEMVGFGYGPHRCQAEWLSRVELEIVFATLFKRLPKLKLAAKPEDLPYTPPTQNVGITELPVLW